MAKTKQRESEARSIAKLTPNSVDVQVDGAELRVAANRHENSVMNMILASQLRHLIQSQIKTYKEDEIKLTPKELADLAKAARDIATFSAEVYTPTSSGSEVTINGEEKEDSASEVAAEEVGFDKITEKNEPRNPPQTGS